MAIRSISTVFIALLIILSSGGCSNGESTYPLTLHFQFDETEASDCTTYLAEKFSVTIYSEDFGVRKVCEFPCPLPEDPQIELSAGIYYLTVSLLGSNGALKSWGSAQVNLDREESVTVDLKEYRGGITLSWPTSLCDDFDISYLAVTAEREGEVVTAIVWGVEKEINRVLLPCAASEFKIQNIESGTYVLTVDGLRSSDSERPRARSSIPPFKVTTGQDTAVSLKNYFELVVSDLFVLWEFDSKSISSCENAGVATVRVRVIADGEGEEEFVQTMACDLSGERKFSFYDLPAGDYTVTVEGLDAAGMVAYGGHKVLTVEKGKVGKEGYVLTIYLKQE